MLLATPMVRRSLRDLVKARPKGTRERSRCPWSSAGLVKARPGGTRERSRGGHSTVSVVATSRLAERGRKGILEGLQK